MQSIDENKLETDLAYRFEYLAEFIGFDAEDAAAIHDSAGWLGPRIPFLVNAVYDKLHAYDCTWRHFLPRHDGYDGKLAVALEDLPVDHPQIDYRKQHLARYMEHILAAPYDAKMAAYLHTVGSIHTTHSGNANIEVPVVQMNALLGFLADQIAAAILDADPPGDQKATALRAFGKLFWIQSDLIARHHA